MKKRTYQVKVITLTTFEHTEGEGTSAVKETKVELVIPPNFNRKMYFKPGGQPTDMGAKTASAVLLTGLIAQLHTQEQMGYIASPANIRWMIDHLQNGFVSIAKDFTAEESIDDTPEFPFELHETSERPIDPLDMEVWGYHPSFKDPRSNPDGWRAGFVSDGKFHSAKWDGDYKTVITEMPVFYLRIKQQ